jgi:hypothetical protein
VKTVALLASLAALTACADIRYRSNLQHARVTPWTHISPEDRERIVWLVAHATYQPIIGITKETFMCRRSTCVCVITGYLQSDLYDMYPWTAINLEKGPTGWRITQTGEVSHIIAGDILNTPE